MMEWEIGVMEKIIFESLHDRVRVLQWNVFVWSVVNLKWVSGVRGLGGNGKSSNLKSSPV